MNYLKRNMIYRLSLRSETRPSDDEMMKLLVKIKKYTFLDFFVVDFDLN
jgi:hypothetical protein